MGSAHAGRRSVGFWSIGCVLALVVVAASGFLGSGPAVAVRSAGHWVYNETLGAVVHVNGAAKNADAQAPVPGANPANQVAQDDKHGYVIGRRNGKLIVFGKSSLQVESTLPLGTTEDPVVVESLGATYLVFPSGGRIVRLGTKLAVITSGGGALASPVAVSDGTVWVRRGGSGGERLCRVQRGSDTMSCPVRVPSGHRGTLTVVDDRPAFVDQTVATIALVSPSGLGQSVPMGASVQAVSDGQVAGADAGGRLAVVTQAGSGRSASLVLVDASTVGSRGQAAPPITVSLGSDLFDPPMTAGGAVVLVDRTANKVITYDNHGVRKASVAGPHGGVMHASRGQDGRVYVDGSGGKTTLVVDGDGTVTPVTNDNGQGKGKPGAPGTTPPAATNGPGTTPTEPPVSGGTPAVPLPSPPVTVPLPSPPVTVPLPSPPVTVPLPSPPVSTPAPEVPDAPATVQAATGVGQADISWTVPSANGSAIEDYLVSWQPTSGGGGGSQTVPAGSQRLTITGLAAGTSYVVQVSARNGVGRGPSNSARFTLGSPLSAPTGVRAVANSDGSATVSWNGPARTVNGSVQYTVKGGPAAVHTTSTNATVAGLTPGQSYRFTVIASDGAATLSAASGSVIAYRAAGSPTGLTATTGLNQVVLTWGAAALNGGKLSGYAVSVDGSTRSTVGATTATLNISTAAVHRFTVRAVTKDPNGTGKSVSGAQALASSTVVVGRAPALTITDGYVDDANETIVVTLEVDAGFLPTTCTISGGAPILVQVPIWTGPCAHGRNVITISATASGDVFIGAVAKNSAGTAPTQSFNITRHI